MKKIIMIIGILVVFFIMINRVQAEDKIFLNYEDAAQYVRECIKVRDERITFKIKTKDTFDEAWEKVWNMVIEHTGKPSEGDYILWQYESYFIEGDTGINGNGTDTGIRKISFYDFKYYTTKEQEEELNNKLTEVINKLDIDNDTDYIKIKKIYDYIVNNVEYGFFEGKDEKLMFTPYAALIHKRAVCQGFSLLFYRMCLEANVDVRVLSGTNKDGIAHSWNIVKLDDKYYNVDTTWETFYKDNNKNYIYFLKDNDHFDDHLRDNGWRRECDDNGCDKYYYPCYDVTSDEFNKRYTMSLIDYFEKNLGDMNSNGIIDLSDILICLKMHFRKIEGTYYQLKVGDMNKNDKIDLADVLILLKEYFHNN